MVRKEICGPNGEELFITEGLPTEEEELYDDNSEP